MYKKMFLTALTASILMTSCSDENDTPNPSNAEGKFLIETTVKNTDGMSGSSYLQLISDFSGKATNENAIQIDFSSPTYVYGNDIFTVPSFSPQSTSQLKKYARTPKGLTEVQSLDLPANSMMQNIVKINNDKAYLPGYALGKVWVINPQTLEKTGEIDLTSYAHTDNSPEPAFGIVRDGYFYLTLNQVASNYMPYGDYLQSDVVVIDIATDKVVKVISEKASGLAFPTRPFLKDMIFTNEQNDIYIACVGFFGLYPQYKKSGFICIPNGKQEFDTTKSWDVSQTNIEGTSYKPAAVLNCKYISNGKLVAFVAISELNGNNPYTAKAAMPVVIDLNAKTIKQIKGVPLSDGHSTFLESYNNLIVIGSYGEEKSGFFTYNPSNDEVKLQLSTVGNPVFFHAFK